MGEKNMEWTRQMKVLIAGGQLGSQTMVGG